MSIDMLLQAGLLALYAGNRTKARRYFSQVVRQEPDSERGWLWLGRSCTEPDQQAYCFRRVLSINPSNPFACQELERLINLNLSAQTALSARSWQTSQMASNPAPGRAHAIRPVAITGSGSLRLVHERVDHIPAPASAQAIPLRSGQFSHPAAGATARLKWAFPGSRFGRPVLLVLGLALMVYSLIRIAAIFSQPFDENQTQAASALQAPSQLAQSDLIDLGWDAQVFIHSDQFMVTTWPGTGITQTLGFSQSACTFDIPEGARVDCGFVTVPEDRDEAFSPYIQLAVAIYHSTSSNPAAEPVLYLTGGPGSALVAYSPGMYNSFTAPLLSEGDVIFFDQRGMGLSRPSLNCPELVNAFVGENMFPMLGGSPEQVYVKAALACRDRLTGQGIHLSAYTSQASAADVRDIVTALGYTQVNLYSVSYGTLLAQVVLRDHPEIVRSAVLDSVVPLEARFLNDSAQNSREALGTLFAGCAADPACSQAYPNFQADFYQLVDELNARPISVPVSLGQGLTIHQSVDGIGLANAMLNVMNISRLIPMVPKSFYQIRGGDYTPLGYALTIPLNLFQNLSLGAYISINCHDEIFTTAPEELDNAIDKFPAPMAMQLVQIAGSAENLAQVCRAWGAAPLIPGENDPVVSDIPVLVIAGRYDPTTPPAYGRLVAQHLSHSYFVEIPDQGHGPVVSGFSDCPLKIARKFWRNPNQAPQSGCLKAIGPVQFQVHYTGNPPIVTERYKDPYTGLSALVPAGWRAGKYGFFYRESSFLDITEIGFQSSWSAREQWLEYLQEVFYGKRGFDQPPEQVGERRAGGLTWMLYRTSLDNRPVDIGFTEYRGQTLMVLMYSHADEHEALYRDVFLNAMESVDGIAENGQ